MGFLYGIIHITPSAIPNMPRRKRDPKAEILRERGCLHPHPEKVSDEAFATNEFFDPRDLVQVKYEMLRRVQVDGDHDSLHAPGRIMLDE